MLKQAQAILGILVRHLLNNAIESSSLLKGLVLLRAKALCPILASG